jgi:GNAT superfamily N-acetyltransferase
MMASHKISGRLAKDVAGFAIRPIDFTDDKVMRRIGEIHELAFPNVLDLRHQLRHNTVDAPKGTVFYGAFDDDYLIGVNGFTRHEIEISGCPSTVYQSCSTATDPAFRGRGVFSAIIRHAQQVLAATGSYIVGFPNENSGPIFVGPLGFQKVPLVKLIVPSAFMGALCSRVAWEGDRRNAGNDETIRFNQADIFAWKKSRSGSPVVMRSIAGVTVWGREQRNTKFGLPITMFLVGGISVGGLATATPGAPHPGRSRTPVFYSLVASSDSALVQTARRWSICRDAGIFIYYVLQPSKGRPSFEVCAGLADFY